MAEQGEELITDQNDIVFYQYEWMSDLLEYYEGDVYHQFILYFNIHDFYLKDNKSFCRSLDEYVIFILKKIYPESAFFFFYPSSGIAWDPGDGLTETLAKNAGIVSGNAGSEDTLINNLDKLGRLFSIEPDTQKIVIAKFMEKIIPAGRSNQPTDLITEKIQRWALDENIRKNKSLIIFTTDTLQMVSDAIYGQGRRCKAIRIPLPTMGQRQVFFEILKQNGLLKYKALGETNGIKALAQMTQGFSLYDCQSLNMLATVHKTDIDAGLLNELKKDIINEQSRHIIEEVSLSEEDKFDSVGGLEGIIKYFKSIKERLISGGPAQKLTVPKGILLVGPPGTGKTILAKALAKESGIPMMRLANIRSKLVGESEKNLERALNLIEDMAPVLIFVDEIDQAIGGRSKFSGDSGVGQRIFGRMLEFMGREDLRGKVLWVTASNRPDILDEAMVRRFDKIFPVLLPGETDRAKIFEALQHTMPKMKYSGVDFHKLARMTKGLTGSDINVIVRAAMEGGEHADDKVSLNEEQLITTINNFKSNHNERMYNLQTLYAVRFCNFINAIPGTLDMPEEIRMAVDEAKNKRNNGPLDAAIQVLSQSLGTF